MEADVYDALFFFANDGCESTARLLSVSMLTGLPPQTNLAQWINTTRQGTTRLWNWKEAAPKLVLVVCWSWSMFD